MEHVLLCSLEVPLLLSRVLKEIGLFNDHRAPCGHDLFDSLSAINEGLALSLGMLESVSGHILRNQM
ncbi:hypothetical protein CDL15_Pgr012418 [Punica granatum]|uniref:Uncharacterized protein n=1 Tax=Punica granatum TaxID=22663 RepID=A0A218WYV6_PUNGR|nr:hypothetical protein CDL15_Pgr012418 [Punica granatum]